MVKGEVIKHRDLILKPVFNYRKLDALNCSMIKLFDSDPVKFFEIYKLGKPKEDKKTTSLIIGDLVDFYLLDCKGDEDEFNHKFDEKFALSEDKIGSGQVFYLAKVLFEISCGYMNPETREISVSFDTRFTEATKLVQSQGYYKGKTEEKILEDFNKNGYDYYQSLVDNYGKIVIDVSLLDKAKRVADMLIKDEFTSDVFIDSNIDEYYAKFPIEWIYTTKTGKKINCKSELDILRIDHGDKKIYPKDLKTTYDNEGFEYSYIKHSYYLQAAFYHLAVRYWADSEDMADYDIEPMEFIVGDTSANNRRPIRYQISTDDLSKGLLGFQFRDTYYKGIHQLVEEISWAEDTDNWNVSKEVFDSKGRLNLNIKYD